MALKALPVQGAYPVTGVVTRVLDEQYHVMLSDQQSIHAQIADSLVWVVQPGDVVMCLSHDSVYYIAGILRSVSPEHRTMRAERLCLEAQQCTLNAHQITLQARDLSTSSEQLKMVSQHCEAQFERRVVRVAGRDMLSARSRHEVIDGTATQRAKLQLATHGQTSLSTRRFLINT